MLSRFVIASLPRSKCLLISWLWSLSTVILEPKKIKSVTASTFSHLFAMKWWDWMPWSYAFECWVLSQLFHSSLSLSFRVSLVPLHFLPWEWYHLHIWGCWCFSQQSWFQLWFIWSGILHDVLCIGVKWTGYYTDLCSFPNLNQTVVPYPVLTVASWPIQRFLRRQIRWSGIPISLRIFHSLLWST